MEPEVHRIDARLRSISIDGDNVEYVLQSDFDEATEALIHEVGSHVVVGVYVRPLAAVNFNGPSPIRAGP